LEFKQQNGLTANESNIISLSSQTYEGIKFTGDCMYRNFDVLAAIPNVNLHIFSGIICGDQDIYQRMVVSLCCLDVSHKIFWSFGEAFWSTQDAGKAIKQSQHLPIHVSLIDFISSGA